VGQPWLAGTLAKYRLLVAGGCTALQCIFAGGSPRSGLGRLLWNVVPATEAGQASDRLENGGPHWPSAWI
jgi:hypothetical protein